MIYDDKPWLKSYDPDVDPEIVIPDLPLSTILVNTFGEFPVRVALHYMGMSLTFGELYEQSGRFAAGLQDQGLGKGDVVAIDLPNIPQYLVAVIGSLRAGCAVSGVSPLLMPDEMAYQLNDCGARALVILDSLFVAKLASVADQISGIEHVLVTGPADYLGNAVTDSLIQPLADKHVTAFMDFLQHGPDEPSQVSYSPADACFIQYTGGTTGPSKGAILTHRNIVANMMMFEHWMKFERGNEVWLTAFPLFHIAGLFVSSCALTLGSTQILIPNPRDLDHIIKECKQNKPVILGNVPSLYLVLLGKNEFRSLDFSGLRYCLSGAAPFPLDAMKDLESVVGEGKIIEVWGMTETSPLITVIPSRGKKKFGSVGLPLPSTSLRVVDLVDGESPVPLGEEGELICSGPQVMSGYLNKPEETKAALREHDGRVWMHTGDIGKMDEDGFVYVVDRLKDMIIVGGFKVFSSEVEDKFYKHPAVGMCALIGVPNPERPGNEIVKLVLQKSEAYKDKPDSEVEAELLAFAKEKLAPYKVPKIFEFVDAVPTTSVGKVDKKAMSQSHS